MARTMLNENSLPKYFWAESVNTACYVLNRVLIRSNLNKTSYEIWKLRKPNIFYFKVLDTNVLFLIQKIILANLIQNPMLVFFLDIQTQAKLIEFITKEL